MRNSLARDYDKGPNAIPSPGGEGKDEGEFLPPQAVNIFLPRSFSLRLRRKGSPSPRPAPPGAGEHPLSRDKADDKRASGGLRPSIRWNAHLEWLQSEAATPLWCGGALLAA